MGMTESEAIEVLRTDSCYECSYGTYSGASECGAEGCRLKAATKLAIKDVSEIQQYRAIGTASEFAELKEKATAKKQGNIHDLDSHLRLSKSGFVCCGATNKEIRYPLISFKDLEYCPRCGQKLDWSEGKE